MLQRRQLWFHNLSVTSLSRALASSTISLQSLHRQQQRRLINHVIKSLYNNSVVSISVNCHNINASPPYLIDILSITSTISCSNSANKYYIHLIYRLAAENHLPTCVWFLKERNNNIYSVRKLRVQLKLIRVFVELTDHKITFVSVTGIINEDFTMSPRS